MSRDVLLRGTLGQGMARIFLADTREMTRTAASIHHTYPVCTAALGRLMTAACIMGVTLKDREDALTLIIKGGGPAGKLIATAHSDGSVKAMLENPRVVLPPKANGKLDVGGAVGRDGTLTCVRDQAFGHPYTGKIDLVSGEIAEDLAQYYTVSEQQPSLVALGVMVGPEGEVISSGGILIQVMPGCPEELISQLELRSPVLGDFSRVLTEYTAEELAHTMFDPLGLEVMEEYQPAFRCDCSRSRIERVLISMGPEELRSMAEEDKGAKLTCHFCQKEYTFSREQLLTLLREAQEPNGG